MVNSVYALEITPVYKGSRLKVTEKGKVITTQVEGVFIAKKAYAKFLLKHKTLVIDKAAVDREFALFKLIMVEKDKQIGFWKDKFNLSEKQTKLWEERAGEYFNKALKLSNASSKKSLYFIYGVLTATAVVAVTGVSLKYLGR